MRWAFILLLLVACAKPNCDLDEIVEQPPRSYPHAAVNIWKLERGWFDSHDAMIYEPSAPRPASAPVLLFLHGYFDATPEPYDTMLRFLARQGFIVIYPSYGNALMPKSWVDNAEAAFSRALSYLDSPDHVKPDRDSVAYIGHSLGGLLALHLAQKNAGASIAKIPQPRLIITLDAAGVSTPAYPFVSIDDLQRIPADTWMLLIMAEESYLKRLQSPDQCQSSKGLHDAACNAFGANRLAFLQTPQIPATQKLALMIPGQLVDGKLQASQHNSVQGGCGLLSPPVDVIDTWGYWKLTADAARDVLRHRSFSTDSGQSARQKARPIVAIDLCLQTGSCPH